MLCLAGWIMNVNVFVVARQYFAGNVVRVLTVATIIPQCFAGTIIHQRLFLMTQGLYNGCSLLLTGSSSVKPPHGDTAHHRKPVERHQPEYHDAVKNQQYCTPTCVKHQMIPETN